MTKFYLIPGTATDKRLLLRQLDQFPAAVVLPWIEPLSRKEPIASYARRMAEAIDPTEPFVIGGVSLGGMIAQEIARIRNTLGVVLISTCSDSKALSWWFRLNGKLTRLLPDAVVRWQLKSLAGMAEKAMPKTVRHRDAYLAMLREMPASLVRWQSGASTEWKLSGPLTARSYHIHGRNDKIIPPGKVHADELIDGGHLINATAAEKVNAFIGGCLSSVEPREILLKPAL